MKKGVYNMKIVFIILYLIFTVLGLILYKYGTNKELLIKVSGGIFNMKISLISILGLLCYVLSFLIYLTVLPKFNLTYIIPITSSLTYIGIFICSVLFLKESIDIYGVIGSITILIGIFVINIRR